MENTLVRFRESMPPVSVDTKQYNVLKGKGKKKKKKSPIRAGSFGALPQNVDGDGKSGG
jgi:hypothetical protein